MSLSQTAEYALRAVVWMAGRQKRPQTVKEVAAGTQVPHGYLAKIMQNLSRANLLTSRRGLGGGFVLARPAASITALEVIRAVDPPPRADACPLGLHEHRHTRCPLHRRLDEAFRQVDAILGETTIAQLSGGPVRE